jgi:hypothetical protein
MLDVYEWILDECLGKLKKVVTNPKPRRQQQKRKKKQKKRKTFNPS